MISPARKLCYRILSLIEFQHLFSDDALNSEDLNQLDIRDRHLTTQIVYGTLRWQALLDYVLTKASSRPWQEVAPGARILLRMSLYQMWFMDRIPDHALVFDAVELAKRELGRGIERYLNGVLRRLARTRPWRNERFQQEIPPWVQVSLPEWLWNRWVGRYGEVAARDLALSLNKPPRAAFRINGSQRESSEFPSNTVQSELVPGAFVRVDAVDVPDRFPYDSTRFHFQDEASQLIPYLLGQAASGSHIWDACAAPGGKSVILCEICGPQGHVVASDLRRERILRLAAFLKGSGNLNADVVYADASGPAPFRSTFDAVLADVPCSGLGTLRRNPEIKWHLQPEELVYLQDIQSRILHSVSEAVRKHGRLLYSTCSTEPEENERVVESFLRTHPGFALERPVAPPGIEAWTGPDHMVRTFPSTLPWDGFFAALMVRL